MAYQQIHNVQKVGIYPGIPSFVKKRRKRGRMGVGIRYEKRVHRKLLQEFGYEYIPSPWFQYSLHSTPTVINFAQPDGLLVQPVAGKITIVEVKYTHHADSYFQLVEKYLPLCKKFFGDNWKYVLCTVVRWYDRAIDYPAEVRICDSIDQADTSKIGVYICRTNK